MARRDEDSGTLNAYLREIAKLPRLTNDDLRRSATLRSAWN